MRLMMNMRNGEAKHTPMSIYVNTVKKYTLFYFLWKDSISNLEQMQSERFARFGETCWDHLKIDHGGVIVLELDAFTNTVAICPPMYNTKTERVEFDRNWYDEAIRDKGWPVSILLVDDVLGMEMVSPNELKQLLTEPPVEIEEVKPVETAK